MVDLRPYFVILGEEKNLIAPNPKTETRNPKETTNGKHQWPKFRRRAARVRHLDFIIGVSFGFRFSDFVLRLRPTTLGLWRLPVNPQALSL
jgi:hypothetical protein